jgi:hypothetical protein
MALARRLTPDLHMGLCYLQLHRLQQAHSVPIVIFDPNLSASWDECLFPECESFDGWIAIWVGGGDLWERMYGSEGSVSIAIEKRNSAG